MNKIATSLALLVMLGCLVQTTAIAQDQEQEKPAETAEADAPVIEIAILLDTSGSMNGLINQARARLWDIVNNLALARKDGQLPAFRVALFEYGKSSVPAEEQHVRQIVPLTDDLDKVAEELFALTTNGGEEYCGAAIDKAINLLGWTEGDHYRAIFIAGNEPFTQGPTNYLEACQKAINQGIVVNTIHCGAPEKGVEGKWEHGALIADGEAMNIDQNIQEAAIEAPQDERLAELSREINKTYLAFGKEGKDRARLQEKLDEEAAKAPGGGGAAQRATSKGGRLYRNSNWDLVDALGEEDFDWTKVKEEDLPEEMQKMTQEEREAYVAEKKAERQKIKDEIKKLADERRKFVAEKRKEMAEEGAAGFGEAVKEALKKQLAKKKYDFKE